MARKSSDSTTTPEPVVEAARNGDSIVFAVSSDASYLDEVSRACKGVPPSLVKYDSVESLIRALKQFSKLNLAFVLFAEPDAAVINALSLRELRLDFPQVVMLILVGSCDQQSMLRFQSLGVHSVLLPPFENIDIQQEMATAAPNVSKFKRHPELMRRGQARIDFLIPSDLSYVLGINFEIALLLKEFDYPPQDVRINIPLACDEAITNAIMHGNAQAADKKVSVQIYISHSRFRMRVRDQGEGFDVVKVSDPTKGEGLMRSHGRGVYLMNQIMDSVEYKEGGRVLEIEKRNPNSSS